MRTFGTDPEFMLKKDGEIHSAIGVIHGSIDNRISLSGHQFYYDNVLAECAVRPASSKEEMLDSLRECFQIFSEMVDPYELVTQASHDFSLEQLDNDEARKAGCGPDWCAYTIKQMPPPKKAMRNNSLRTSGGHVHLGCEILREDGPHQIMGVYMLDLLLGVTSLWLDSDPTSKRRRKLYGQAGRYRVAGPAEDPYGIEYRSLGNFWLRSPKLASLVYDLSMLAIDWTEDGTAESLWSFNLELFLELQGDFQKAYKSSYDIQILQSAINNSDLKLAKPFVDMILEMMPQDIANKVQNAFSQDYGTLKNEWQLS